MKIKVLLTCDEIINHTGENPKVTRIYYFSMRVRKTERDREREQGSYGERDSVG